MRIRHTIKKYDCLNQEYEAYNDDIVATYGYLDEEDYNNTLDDLGIVEEQSLIDFEAALFPFISYRAHFAAAEEQWLSDGADENNDPDDYNWIDDPVKATLYSEHGAIMIGGVIYYIAPDGTGYSITDGNCLLLDALIADPNTTDPAIVKAEYLCHPECWCGRHTKGHVNYNGNKRIKWKLVHDCSGTVEQRVVMKSLRKFLWIFWRRYRIVGTVTAKSDFYDKDCIHAPFPLLESSYSGRRWRFVKVIPNPWYYPCIHTDETCGKYEWPSGDESHCLSW